MLFSHFFVVPQKVLWRPFTKKCENKNLTLFFLFVGREGLKTNPRYLREKRKTKVYIIIFHFFIVVFKKKVLSYRKYSYFLHFLPKYRKYMFFTEEKLRSFNPFQPSVPFLYPLIISKTFYFLMLSGHIKMDGLKWAKGSKFS